MGRVPFDPPYFEEDLPQLDALHEITGFGPWWMESKNRAEIALMSKPAKVVPVVVYDKDGTRTVIGEAFVGSNGIGNFKIHDREAAKSLLSFRTGDFSLGFDPPNKDEGGPLNV